MKQKDLISSILTYISIAISALTIIPFSLDKVMQFESVIKFIVFPIMILIISGYSLYQRYKLISKQNNKEVLNSMIPIVCYISSVFFYLSTIPYRNHLIGINLKLGNISGWQLIFVCFILTGIILSLLAMLLIIAQFKDKSKTYFFITSGTMYVIFILCSVLGRVNSVQYLEYGMYYKTNVCLILYLSIAIVLSGIYTLLYIYSNKKIESQ